MPRIFTFSVNYSIIKSDWERKKWEEWKYMSRMQTFLKYALYIILFYLFSNFAISTMLKTTYRNVGSDNIHIEQSNNGFEINVDRADSNRRQAYFTGSVKNTSNQVIDKQYVKVDSYYKGKLMQEKYLAFENMQPGEERKFKLLYNVGNVDEYRVSYVDEIPENRTIVDDAIDGVKGFVAKVKNGSIFANTPLSGLFGSSDGNKNGNGGVRGAIDNLFGSFKPVHVEGNDWQLFVAVMWVWYMIPSGAIWFIL